MRRVAVELAALSMAALATGTVPAVGGYSITSPRSESTTVGIVTQVEGGAFVVEAGSSVGTTVSNGRGLGHGDKLWVEPESLVRITDTNGGRVTVAGPAAVEFARTAEMKSLVRLSKGSVKLVAAEHGSMGFESAFVAGSVSGEGAVWASNELVQIVGLSGETKAWHPKLASDQITVAPGYFTEASGEFKHLQPQKPEQVDSGLFEDFLSRFDESIAIDGVHGQAKREIASVAGQGAKEKRDSPPTDHLLRGSRSPVDVLEPHDRESEKWLTAHIRGRDIDEIAEPVPLASSKGERRPAGVLKFDAFGQPMKPKTKVVKRRED